MATLAALAPFVPFAQTLLWVLLILVLIVWFRKSVRSLLSAIQQRIESGSSVKAGPFELSELVRPQTPAQQKQRASEEIAEIAQQVAAAPGAPPPPTKSAESVYFQAEDLALRALQAEYGVPIQRSVVVGPSREVDGLFAVERQVYVAEVKLQYGAVSEEKLRMSLRRARDAAFQVGGPSARVALVLVFRREEDIAANEARVRRLMEREGVDGDLWLYSLSELREKFGASAADA